MSAADNGAAMRAAFDEYADQAGFKRGPDEDTGRGPAWRAWQEATRRASARIAAVRPWAERRKDGSSTEGAMLAEIEELRTAAAPEEKG